MSGGNGGWREDEGDLGKGWRGVEMTRDEDIGWGRRMRKKVG